MLSQNYLLKRHLYRLVRRVEATVEPELAVRGRQSGAFTEENHVSKAGAPVPGAGHSTDRLIDECALEIRSPYMTRPPAVDRPTVEHIYFYHL